jgi:hypothetical protein
MHRYEFKPDDLFVNRLKTYPEYNIFIYQGKMFVNRDSRISGSGGIVVYDINTNRIDSADKVYPFVVSGSTKPAFKSQKYQPLVKNNSGDFQWASAYVGGVAQESVTRANNTYSNVPTGSLNGESIISSSYGFESPISRLLTHTTGGYQADYFDIVSASTGSSGSVEFSTATNLYTSALQNVARKYTTLSDHFIFKSSSVRSRDLVTTDGDNINFIFIPSMYYGSTIKKGSVELNYYITGSKIASCADINHNGTLIGTTGSTSGSVVGLVMYDEGVIMLTSSVELESNNIEYVPIIATSGSWLYYGTTLNDSTGSSNTLASASYDLNFKGTSYVNSMTMFAHARKGHLNHSNNPTYKDPDYIQGFHTGSGEMFEEFATPISNTVSASYVSASFEKTTYISKVHIYDEDGNLIAITSMASPVKKTLEDEFTFKMKLDL